MTFVSIAESRDGVIRGSEDHLASPTYINTIPLRMPRRMIMVRLGHRQTRTRLSPSQQRTVDRTMAEGFALCRPRGCWTRVAIVERREGRLVLEDGTVLASAALSRLLRESTAVAAMATTVGPDIVEAAAAAVAREDGATAVTYDAVGGQTAEAAMGWMCDLVRQQLRRQGEQLTGRRFSPGYGDLPLESQQIIHRWLRLERLGLSLTSGSMLVPEKSVTALAGIERTHAI